MICRVIYRLEQEIQGEQHLTYYQLNIINAFLKLWLEVEFWMEKYLDAVVYDTRNLKAVTNQVDNLPNKIYGVISMFYGTEIAENIKQLMYDFIKSEMEVIKFMNYADNEFANSKIMEMYKAADNLAAYSPKINSHWNENQMKYFLYQYINLKTSEIRALANDDYVKRNQIYERINNVIFLLSDYMGRGIIASNIQIPQQ